MKLKHAESQADFFKCMQIRGTVFVNEQAVDIDIEIDDEDYTCDHYLLIDNEEKAIGTCRIINEGKVAHLGRVALLKEARGKGYGEFLLAEAEKICQSFGFEKIVLGAQVRALGFYEKSGFVPYGDIFLDADIDHRMMEKKI